MRTQLEIERTNNSAEAIVKKVYEMIKQQLESPEADPLFYQYFLETLVGRLMMNAVALKANGSWEIAKSYFLYLTNSFERFMEQNRDLIVKD